MENNRPVIFIGSSKEGLPVAEALQVNLDYVAEVVLWSQGVFGLSEGTLESLVKKLPGFDFAILVLTPDDVAITTSGEAEQLPRDNVLLELGLFMGKLGRDRCFVVYDRSKQMKLPSDLAGVTLAKFQLHSSGNLVSSLGSASTQIKTAIAELGRRPRETEHVYIDATTQYRVIADLLEPQLIQFFILMHETGVVLYREDWGANGVRWEYRDDKGIALGRGCHRVNDMCIKLADSGLLTADLRGNVNLTERGHVFSDWLVRSGYKTEHFWCDYGSWGTQAKPFDKIEDF
jgi:hypothetical protein